MRAWIRDTYDRFLCFARRRLIQPIKSAHLAYKIKTGKAPHGRTTT